MKKIIIRTNFNNKIGLGHLFRMKLLAETLSKKAKIIFYLDSYDKIVEEIIKFQCVYLYPKNEKFKNQYHDALKLKNKIKSVTVDCIIVDDYRLNKKWEKIFYNIYPLIIFDDNHKNQHCCDLLIDAKWTGTSTYSRYKKLTNKNAVRLCGPKFSIINNKSKRPKEIKGFNIMFYLGGGGELKKYVKFLLKLSKTLLKTNVNKIFVIYGPIANNSLKITNQIKKLKNVQIIKNNYNLSKILNKTKLFIGVSSSVIYELNYRNILSVLFPVADNQKNSITDLNDLGFNFILENKDFTNQYIKTSLFINLLIKNFKRCELKNFKKISIDNLGSKRISDVIFKIINKKKDTPIISSLSKFSEFKYNNKLKNKKNGFYKVTDNLINEYLDCKNLKANRMKSINQKKISRVNHYIWWFTNKSRLFYYIRDNKIRIFFNHRLISINKNNFYYGGWFITKNKSIITDPMLVVKWQIKKFRSYPWLAIIKKKNFFVYKLNKYLDFKEIKFNKKFKSYFNILNPKNYYLLKK